MEGAGHTPLDHLPYCYSKNDNTVELFPALCGGRVPGEMCVR